MSDQTKSTSGETIVGWVVIILVGYGLYFGIPKAIDFFKSDSNAKASAPDPRDEEIKALEKRINELAAKPKEHHYELKHEGFRTWRFDPESGDTCIQLTTKEDWKKPDTVRQGCDYNDYLAKNPDGYLWAECWYAKDKKSCEEWRKDH